MTKEDEIWNEAIEKAAQVAQSYFVGMFTGWMGYTSESLITLDNAEDTVNEGGSMCADAIRNLKRK